MRAVCCRRCRLLSGVVVAGHLPASYILSPCPFGRHAPHGRRYVFDKLDTARRGFVSQPEMLFGLKTVNREMISAREMSYVKVRVASMFLPAAATRGPGALFFFFLPSREKPRRPRCRVGVFHSALAYCRLCSTFSRCPTSITACLPSRVRSLSVSWAWSRWCAASSTRRTPRRWAPSCPSARSGDGAGWVEHAFDAGRVSRRGPPFTLLRWAEAGAQQGAWCRCRGGGAPWLLRRLHDTIPRGT